MEIERGSAEQKLQQVGQSISGETFSDLFLKYQENQVNAHPLEVELVARAWELAGGIGSGRLHTKLTEEDINRAGMSMLAELQENNLLR